VFSWEIWTGVAVDFIVQVLIRTGVVTSKSREYQEFRRMDLGILAIKFTFIELLENYFCSLNTSTKNVQAMLFEPIFE
jgi:hypothetical protein